MDLFSIMLDIAKVAGGATLGVWATAWHERRKSKTQSRESQALLMAEVGALREAARRAREWKSRESSQAVVLHLERVIRCFDMPDFIVKVAHDNWMRKQLLLRYQRYKSLRDRLVTEGAVPDEHDLAGLLDDYVFGNLERNNRWRRPPIGTRYTYLLEEGQSIEIRWYHAHSWFRLWRAIRKRRRNEALQNKGVVPAVGTPNPGPQADV